MLFNFSWNVSRGIENGRQHNYGCHQLWRIEEINQRAQKLGLELPHPDLSHRVLPSSTEQFCTRYSPTPEVLKDARDEANGVAGDEEPHNGKSINTRCAHEHFSQRTLMILLLYFALTALACLCKECLRSAIYRHSHVW